MRAYNVEQNEGKFVLESSAQTGERSHDIYAPPIEKHYFLTINQAAGSETGLLQYSQHLSIR